MSTSRTTSLLQKRLKTVSSRPLSTSRSTSLPWTRPIPEGVNPAYDASLALLSSRSSSLLAKADRLRSRLSSEEDESVKRAIGEAAKKVELEAKISRPELRWAFENGSEEVDEADRAVLNELAERKWRKDGELDRLMERIITMKVIPDLISIPAPQISVSIPDHTPGDFLLPSQTVDVPEIKIQSFAKTQDKLYTLVMVDLDCPAPETLTFKEYCHWIVPNIPITNQTTSLPSDIPAALPYQPPHPSPETPYHRYTLLLLEQPSASPVTPSVPSDRSSFSLRQWMKENQFSASPADSSCVKGITMFREGGKTFGQAWKTSEGEWKREKEVVGKVWKEV